MKKISKILPIIWLFLLVGFLLFGLVKKSSAQSPQNIKLTGKLVE
jgi:hypothetical protein